MITSILGDSHYYGSGENSCCYNYIVTTFFTIFVYAEVFNCTYSRKV